MRTLPRWESTRNLRYRPILPVIRKVQNRALWECKDRIGAYGRGDTPTAAYNAYAEYKQDLIRNGLYW